MIDRKIQNSKNFRIMLSGLISTQHDNSKITNREPHFITQNYLRLSK